MGAMKRLATAIQTGDESMRVRAATQARRLGCRHAKKPKTAPAFDLSRVRSEPFPSWPNARQARGLDAFSVRVKRSRREDSFPPANFGLSSDEPPF